MANNTGDLMVRATQVWLNRTYGNDSRFKIIPESAYGKTGWTTIYALTRALQIELGIQTTADNFGPTTEKLFKTIYVDNELCKNMYGIIQGALWCKGYNPGHYATMVDGEYIIDTAFDDVVSGAIKKLEADAGRANPKGIVDLNVMKALLSMDYFVCSTLYGGDEKLQKMQQYINRNYEAYIGLSPCDGIYSRGTNTSLIYAIQSEENMPVSVANGNFGPSTKKYCPTLPYDSVAVNYSGSKYTTEQIKRFIKLSKIALYVNGYGDGSITETYDSSLVTRFQKDYALAESGICNLGTWLSLLISSGDTSRSAKACDCATILTDAKAKTLYNNGYRYVGRYLSGTIVGGASKALSIEELKIAYANKLRIFPIQQASANKVSYFTEEKAMQDVDSAYRYASALEIPNGTIIYFAVDCDPQDTEITSNIIPYFKTVHQIMNNNKGGRYRIGIYGTRNVCSRVSESGYAVSSFVSDMSTGFSGNLGFSLPKNWAFDQFATITVGSGDGQIEIDKDGFSGRDTGIDGNFYLSDVERVCNTLKEIHKIAMEYSNNNMDKSNKLLLQYLRKREPYGKYGGKFGSNADDNYIMWSTVAGEIDNLFCSTVEARLGTPNLTFKDPKENVNYDTYHFAATLNALLHPLILGELVPYENLVDIYAGWGGDMVTFADNIVTAKPTDELQWARENICRDKYSENNFSLADYIADIDAVNIGGDYNFSNTSLADVFEKYITSKVDAGKSSYSKRYFHFLTYMTIELFELFCDKVASSTFPSSMFNKILTKKNPTLDQIKVASTALKYRVYEDYLKDSSS